ncbi:uncharacterized protein LOC112045811 [Bicyclus anynana]|uniref:Uncharacterized protein LOC112045811 n=1 Tax=Bicyclus anynana TaxID=110368 RepID=A0A6J1MYM2_BICAN|nr:uncharacterized protein LOC112045811 [Bicyclus anynana]
MKAVKYALIGITMAAILPEVTSWIVDMTEVEKLLGNDQADEEANFDDDIWPSVASDDNEVMYTANYAENFNYETYKKKEVDSIIRNGGAYLEGLSNAMAAYRDTLEDCNRNSSKTSIVSDTNGEVKTRCEKAEKKKDYVQKLSEMALLTTDKMRDKDYDDISQERTEDGDLIRLAWTLDRLAALTGYSSAHGDTVSSNGVQDNNPKSSTEANMATEDNRQLEILEQVENGRPLPPKLTDTRSVQKRDTGDVMKYYLKYKVWNASNAEDDHRTSDNDPFDIQNSLKVLPIRKRSLAYKKATNMRSAIQKIRRLRCQLKDRSEIHFRKLVKSIKVYRRKIFSNDSH